MLSHIDYNKKKKRDSKRSIFPFVVVVIHLRTQRFCVVVKRALLNTKIHMIRSPSDKSNRVCVGGTSLTSPADKNNKQTLFFILSLSNPYPSSLRRLLIFFFSFFLWTCFYSFFDFIYFFVVELLVLFSNYWWCYPWLAGWWWC